MATQYDVNLKCLLSKKKKSLENVYVRMDDVHEM